MPLDVQPLSANRRALMLLVMLALLGGSLAFADYLVMRRTKPWVLSADFSPYGFAEIDSGDGTNGLIYSARGLVKEQWRRVDVLRFSYPGSDDSAEQQEVASKLFFEMLGVKPTAMTNNALIAGRRSIEAVGSTNRTRRQPGMIGMVRVLIENGRALAICYSGAEPYSPTDKQTFDEICQKGVRLQS